MEESFRCLDVFLSNFADLCAFQMINDAVLIFQDWYLIFNLVIVQTAIRESFCFRTLCSSGAFVNAANAKGETPLHDAIHRGSEPVVRCLLTHGADPSLKDKQGVDCFELATKLGGAMLPSLSMNT